MLEDLKGKKILVAGASSGIGEACAKYLAECGASVFICARREKELERVLREMSGKGHRAYPFDFSHTIEIEGFVKQLVEEDGVLDGLVFSVGVSSSRPLKKISVAHMQEIMNINFFSFLELVRSCTTKNVYNKERFSIVAVSSISSLLGNMSKTAYAASKAAIDASVRCIAKELHTKNIRINSVNPGWVRTNLYDQQIAAVGDFSGFQDVFQRQYQGIIETVDVAKTVAFLLSDDSHFITGLSIPIDGGRISS